MIERGIIQADGTVLEANGKIHQLPLRGVDPEGYPEVLMDAKKAGGSGWMHRQSVKPFIGYVVEFVKISPDSLPFNHVVLTQ